MFSTYAYAETISYDEAKAIAESDIIDLPNSENEQLKFSKELLNLGDEIVAYYFQFDSFYIIVGADKQYYPIIEYGEKDCFLLEVLDSERLCIDEVQLMYLGELSYAYIYIKTNTIS